MDADAQPARVHARDELAVLANRLDDLPVEPEDNAGDARTANACAERPRRATCRREQARPYGADPLAEHQLLRLRLAAASGRRRDRLTGWRAVAVVVVVRRRVQRRC